MREAPQLWREEFVSEKKSEDELDVTAESSSASARAPSSGGVGAPHTRWWMRDPSSVKRPAGEKDARFEKEGEAGLGPRLRGQGRSR